MTAMTEAKAEVIYRSGHPSGSACELVLVSDDLIAGEQPAGEHGGRALETHVQNARSEYDEFCEPG